MNIAAWDYITSLGICFYEFQNENLSSGNKVCKPNEKLSCLDFDEESSDIDSKKLICSNQGCNIGFDSVLELEIHQWAKHAHVCNSCKRVFPSHHLLEIHVLEFHDSFFEVAAHKKPMFSCLLEHCGGVFCTPQERKEHCINVHKFPSDFRYDLKFKKLSYPKLEKVKKRNSCKTKNGEDISVLGKNNSEEERMECADMEGNELRETNQTSLETYKPKLTHSAKVPKSLSFGIGVPRGFIRERGNKKGKYWHQKNKAKDTRTHLEQISMNDITETLDEMET